MRNLKIKPLAALIILAAAVAGTALMVLPPACVELAPAELLSIPVASLAPGAAQLFCYRDAAAGKKIRFILARGSDGRIRAAFDACRQCYGYHEGYKVKAGAIICRFCGNRYPIDHMMEGKASCAPIELPHEEHAGVVQIKAADLRKGRELF